MPVMPLLPLGTLFKPKKLNSKYPDMRLMISSYFSLGNGDSNGLDYFVTPWPMGFYSQQGRAADFFLAGNEDQIEQIEFIGCVSDEAREAAQRNLDDASGDNELTSPLATGTPSIALSMGDLPSTFGNLNFNPEEMLPLGSVVSVSSSSTKLMIVQQTVDMYSSSGKRVDYIGAEWPYGACPSRGSSPAICADDITALHFRGYENAVSQGVMAGFESEGWHGKKRSFFRSCFTRVIGDVKWPWE